MPRVFVTGLGFISPIGNDAAAVVDTLSERFGINVADVGERGQLEARIDRLLSAQPGPQSP